MLTSTCRVSGHTFCWPLRPSLIQIQLLQQDSGARYLQLAQKGDVSMSHTEEEGQCGPWQAWRRAGSHATEGFLWPVSFCTVHSLLGSSCHHHFQLSSKDSISRWSWGPPHPWLPAAHPRPHLLSSPRMWVACPLSTQQLRGQRDGYCPPQGLQGETHKVSLYGAIWNEAVLVRASVAVIKDHDRHDLGRKGFMPAYTSTAQSTTEGHQGRN